MNLRKLRQVVDSILNDEQLMKEIFLTDNQIEEENLIYCAEDMVKQFLKRNFNLNAEVPISWINKIAQLWYKRFRKADTFYKPKPIVDADVVPYLADTYEDLPLSKEAVIAVFKKDKEEFSKEFFNTCFYIDYDRLSETLWNYLREDIEEILRG